MLLCTLVLIFFSIIAIIGGIIFNFHEFINDYRPVNLKNVIATFLYIIIWIFILIISLKNHFFRIIKLFSAFWFASFITANISVFINMSEANAGWAIPLVILFLSQWYGLKYFIGSSVNICVIIAFLSLLILTIDVISIQQNRYKKV